MSKGVVLVAKFERSRIPLYISSVFVFIGIIGHTIGAVNYVSELARSYEDRSFSNLAEKFIAEWFGSWVWSVFDDLLWILPTTAVLYQLVWLLTYLIKRVINKRYAESLQSYKQRKISFLLFLISFAPIVLIFLYSLYSMFAGYKEGPFMGECSMYYGTEAFFRAMFWTCLMLTILPVLPFMLIWQIVYLVRKFRK